MTENRFKPLPILVMLYVVIDVCMACVASWQSTDEFRSIFWIALIGLLWGQFGTCCAIWLRFPSLRRLAIGGMLVITLVVIGIVTDHGRPNSEGAAFTVAIGLGFTAVYCLGPILLWRWLSSRGFRQFSLSDAFVATTVAAVFCLAAMNYQLTIMIAVVVLLIASPTIIASTVSATINDRSSFALLMFFICNLSLAVGAVLGPIDKQAYTILLTQSTITWLGGTLLMSVSANDDPSSIEEPTA
ncbi:hypothetical protein GC197_13465 [bacterium]|nr:hypothetical protein [bacterium]